jgi:hypothetical protein
MTRTELTFKCSAFASAPLARLVGAPAVEPLVALLAVWSIVPITSTRLPTFDAVKSDEVPSRT